MGSKDQRHQQKLHLGNGGAFGSTASTTAHHNLYSSHFTCQIYYEKVETQEREPKKMSRTDGKGENDSTSPLVLDQLIITTAANSSASSASSPTSSCVTTNINYSRGCLNCHLYVMLKEDNLKCPKCKGSVLLDFLWDYNTKNNKGSREN
ncbi:hypothetical protein MKW92_017481 [Papaver armeniacum]|nr:hypothetical protein MKW92_017481 [Papaver armeniacum]